MSDEKSPARICHRRFATSCSEMESIMHKVQAKAILSAKNGMNIYRGCQHGCIYCDARSTCYQMNHVFEDIEVKENAPQLLEAALKRKRKKCMIGTGAMSDPYMPLEMELNLTRQCAELIERYGFGLTVLTKSDNVLRDLDLFCRINAKTKCVIQMTLTTMDDVLSRKIEPGVCTTARRIEVLNILKEEGIPTVVWLTPLLPFINDAEENIFGILEACQKASVRGIMTFHSFGVTLRDGDRQYFYSQLDKKFPGLRRQYIEAYGNAYELPIPRDREIFPVFREKCEAAGIEWRTNQIFEYLNTFEEKGCGQQMTLADFI